VLGLDYGGRAGISSRGERAAKDVISAAGRAFARLVVDDVDWLCGFLDADVCAAVPAAVFEGRINQFESGLGFVTRHRREWGCPAWCALGAWWPERDTLTANSTA
jgi:hypothetical protein